MAKTTRTPPVTSTHVPTPAETGAIRGTPNPNPVPRGVLTALDVEVEGAGGTVTGTEPPEGGIVVGNWTPVGPTTLGGDSSPEGSCGVGSNDTHPDAAPR